MNPTTKQLVDLGILCGRVGREEVVQSGEGMTKLLLIAAGALLLAEASRQEREGR